MKIIEPSVEMLWSTLDPEGCIELAGRTCYKSEDKITENSSSEFVKMILRRGHDSVLEHATISVRVICDRGVSHEFVRSRIGFSYSQESTRYCDYSLDKFKKEITVIKPSCIQANTQASLQERITFENWYNAMLEAEKSYFKLIQLGCAPQTARSVLPTCLKTEIVVTANIRAWRNFLKQRLSPKAHPDMQIIANMIYRILVEISPNCFFDINPTN